MRQVVTACGVALAGIVALVLGLAIFPDLLLAGGTRISPGPAPLIGVGLPIAGAVVAAVLVARHYRRKG
jgi:hypothetical protein